MSTSVDKWLTTIQISAVKHTTYRLNFLLLIIGPALIFFFVKYNLWKTIFGNNPNTTISGYNFSQMINYHCWVMVVWLLTQGHSAMNLAEEIRLGRISSYLIYPFNFWEFHAASFVSFQLLQIVVAGFTLTTFYLFDILQLTSLTTILYGVTYALFVSTFWFAVQFILGLVGFWLEETWIMAVIVRIMASLLSGAILPLDFFPPDLVKILQYTPFPYLTYVPIKIFLGQPVNMLYGLLVISCWLLFFIFLSSVIWKRGIKQYTAAGM